LPIVTDDNDGHGGGEEEKINRVNNPHATKIDRNLTGFGITLVSHQIRDHFGDYFNNLEVNTVSPILYMHFGSEYN